MSTSNSIRTSEMRLHALQGPNICSQTLELHRTRLRQDMSLNSTTRPEFMEHPAPRILRIGTKVTRPILPDYKSRRCLRELQVHDAGLVDIGFDGVAFPVLAELHAAAVGMKVLHIFGKLYVGEVVGAP